VTHDRIVRVVAAAILVAAVAGCGDDPPSRGDALGEYAEEVAVPAFERIALVADDVAGDVEAACADPGEESIAAAAESIAELRTTWLSTQASWTGPVMERRSPAVVDWPVRPADIEALIERSAPGEITADVIGNNVGADTRGLTAMRWVLERDDADDLLADERWCDYLRSSAEVIAAEAGLLVGDWTESWDDGPAFSDLIADDAEADSWLEMLVNDNIFLAHAMTEEPADEGDVPAADVAGDRAAQLLGMYEVAVALRPLLGDDLGERLANEIESARATYASGDVDGGRQAAALAEATLASEVVARLDITIGFSDADGDSAG
jgi:predicted lipoprotein